MKKTILGSIAFVVVFLAILGSCSDSFLEINPQGSLGVSALANKPGVEAALIGAYALLDGYHIDNNNTWPSDPVNWILGSVPSDDAYKGSEQGDIGEITLIELYQWSAGNSLLGQKYIPLYEGVTRTNSVINLLAASGTDVDDIRDRVQGEALFLRAYYHFELYKVFGPVPYFIETDTDFRKTNEGSDPLAMAIADVEAAVPLLPETQSDKGRVTKKAAQAFLGKLYMYDLNFDEAIANFEAAGVPDGELVNCQRDLFQYDKENSAEALFSVQMSTSNAAQARNSNWLNQLANPVGGGFGCCGFHQPSQNLVNAYKVNASGLPLLDDFNAADLDPAVDFVDPRIDLTIGRDGVPYWDWATHAPGFIRSRSYSGPYSPKKFQPYKTSPIVAGGWNGAANNGVNVPVIRMADAMLLLAEAYVEKNRLADALELVNKIRTRAGNCAQGPMELPDSNGDGQPEVLSDAAVIVDAANMNGSLNTWANYNVKPYPAVWADQATARKAVRFERRLELALEGHRFFDIRRWDDMAPGYAATLLNGFVAAEKSKRSYYNDASTYQERHRWYPFPTQQIQLSIVGGVPQLKQNPGW
ncbi:MAG TPA: RagB/SusD family nutrient uptake outer membrane protein [Ohtaekwangia sp.]